MNEPPVLSDDQPFDDDVSALQTAGILELLGGPPKRVLELGCGGGRVLHPIAKAGHQCVGIDVNSDALKRCADGLEGSGGGAVVELLQCDFLHSKAGEWSPRGERFDAVLCMGNTFMTIVDVADAVALLERVRSVLSADGLFIIDAIPQEHWPELIEGNWQAGTSGDGAVQMVWARDDAVFALREGERVNEESWEPVADDRPLLRLWTMGCLRLAAKAAGLSGPEHVASANLLVFRP